MKVVLLNKLQVKPIGVTRIPDSITSNTWNSVRLRVWSVLWNRVKVRVEIPVGDYTATKLRV